MATVFVTPGLIPLDAFTQFAVHAKPNSDNPIGHFGTGLKYAVAIILRYGGTFKMWRGGVEYEFYTHQARFRGTNITTIRMRKRNGIGKWLKSYKLPFTVDLGRNWGLWQAYRELLSNTYDENGWVERKFDASTCIDEYHTVIEIDCEGFEDAQKGVSLLYELNNENLNWNYPDASSELMDVWRRPSKYIYYKGIRVHELPIPSYFTYNFKKGITLSEDRSIMNQYEVLNRIAIWIDGMDFEAVKGLFADEENRWFEAHELSFFNLTQTQGTMRLVAETFGSSGGYYLRALTSSLVPVEPTNYNLDLWFDRDELYDFVISWQNGDVEDTDFVRMFKQWLTQDEPGLLEYIRKQAKLLDDQLPFDLEE